MIKFSSKFKSKSGLSIDSSLKKLILTSKTKSKIGVLSSNNPTYKDGMNAATVLATHVYGSVSRNIPKRDPLFQPFMENKQKILQKWSELLNFYLKKQDKPNLQEAFKQSLNDISFFIVNDIVKDTILKNGNGKWQALSEETIKRKLGSQQMLIDTGSLINSINFELYDK
jgi:hypothetical protein